MLIKEDDAYLRKIQFPDTLHKLIEVINSFSHVEKASLLKLIVFSIQNYFFIFFSNFWNNLL